MKVPKDSYDLETFCQALLAQDESRLFEGLHYNQVKTYFYLTEDDNWCSHFGDQYDKEDYGDVVKLTSEYTKRSGGGGRATFYATYFQDELLMIFTAATEEAIDQTLEQTVNHSSGLASMPIVPPDFQKMNKQVLDDYEDVKITEFKSIRIPDLADAEIRPEFDRIMEYKGRDGRQTLKEFRQYYGVVPVRLQYEHEDIEFKMDSSGKFTLKRVNEETFNLLFKLVEEVLDHVLDIQDVTQKIRFQKEQRQSGDLEITVSNVTAGEINFDKSFNLLMAEEFVQNVANRDAAEFTFTDVSMQAGSLDFSAMVTDERRNSYFNISATEVGMRIIPKRNCSFPSLIEFFQLFTQSVDQSAQIKLFDSEAAYGTQPT